MPAEFRYGNAWESYPVEPGEFWRVGPHIVYCGDVEEDAALTFLARVGVGPAMVYTDPPWDKGNARAFRTKANKQTPEIETRAVDFDSLISKAFDAVRSTGGPIFVEMGLASAERVKELALGQDVSFHKEWDITYYGNKPCKLLLMAASTLNANYLLYGPFDPSGMNEPAAACIDIGSMGGDEIFDPFMGQGLVAESAAKLGRVAWGVELNPRRMAVTLAKLAKITREEPCKL